jgi:hypothetical protein
MAASQTAGKTTATKMTAPRFEYVLGAAADTDAGAVKITFLGTDKKKYAVELSAHCAGLTIAAASAYLGRVQAALPPDARMAVQPVTVAGVRTQMRDNGNAGLMIVLESGAELPLEFQRDDLVKLSALFAEMAAWAAPGEGYVTPA